MVSTLLDAGLLFLLRFALDDGVEGVMSAAVHALKALLVCEEDEVRTLEKYNSVSLTFVHHLGHLKYKCVYHCDRVNAFGHRFREEYYLFLSSEL